MGARSVTCAVRSAAAAGFLAASLFAGAAGSLAAQPAAAAAPTIAPERAAIPVPRPAPRARSSAHGTLFASSTRRASGKAKAGPPLPLPLAIRRELTVDVSLAVADAYAAREYRPLWTKGRAASVLARLRAAERDGLDPAHYRVPPGLTPAQRDVAITERVLAYARHAHSGRIAPSSISRIVTLEPPRLDDGVFLAALALSGDPVRVMESAHPPHREYRRLRDALRAALDARTKPERPRVGEGPYLRRGARSPRVARLRARLGATVARGTDPTHFGDTLHEAVKAFQRANGLAADGIVGRRTVAALDADAPRDIKAELVSNMERWRWMPRRLGARHVRVNIPAFRVRVVEGADVAYDGRVIVGTPSNPTPIFSDEIEHVVVNPYWNVPYSIAKNEMLGAIRANPNGYFRRRGYEAVLNGRVVNPASVSWDAATLRRVRVRQRPGRGNALGAVKFLFPNKHAVYLHDTPTKHLFGRAQRAYSHGCVRVEDPFVFAQSLLARDPALSGDGLRRMVGGGQRWLNVSETIPVHLSYFTLEVAPDGTVQRLRDIYGFDRRTQRALERRDALS